MLADSVDSGGRPSGTPRSRRGRPPPRSPLGVSRRQVLTAGGTGLLAATATASKAGARLRQAPRRGPTAPPSRSTSPGATTRRRPSWCPGRRPAGRTGPGSGSGSGSSPPPSAPVPDPRSGERHGHTTRAWTGCAPARPTGTRSPPTTTPTRPTRSAPRSAPRRRDAPPSGSPASATSPRRTRMGALLRPGRLRGGRGGDLPAAVPPGQRRPATPTRAPPRWPRPGGTSVTTSRRRRRTGRGCRCPGNHALGAGDGEQGLASFLARYTLPANGVAGFEGRWYAFRVGTAPFVCLSGDDVAYQDAAAFVAGPAALTPAAGTGHPAIPPGTSCYLRGYSGGAQTGGSRRPWRPPAATPRSTGSSCSCTSAPAPPRPPGTAPTWASAGNGCRCSTPTRSTWCCPGTTTGTSGPSRSAARRRRRPRRGDRRGGRHPRPHPVTTVDSGVFDTSQGTVHLVLGCGGTDANLDDPGADSADGHAPGQGAHPANRPALTAAPGAYGRARRRRRRGRDLVRAARRLARLRHRGIRRQPGQRGGRPDLHHRRGTTTLPARTRPPGPGSPVAGDRRRLRVLRDVHPGQPIRRPPLAPEGLAANRDPGRPGAARARYGREA